MNHLDVWTCMGFLQMNAAIMAAGLFAFIAYRLRAEQRAKQMRQQAAAFLIW
ncbi:MAG TPA: hypothetical protein VGG58_05040 [Candidatus Acidoferrum sp.]